MKKNGNDKLDKERNKPGSFKSSKNQNKSSKSSKTEESKTSSLCFRFYTEQF